MRIVVLLIVVLFTDCYSQRVLNNSSYADEITSSRIYYVDNNGDDNHPGTQTHPFKTISKLNGIVLQPGDSVYFIGGQTFYGTLLLDSNDMGTKDKPVVITSAGKERATILSGNYTAITAEKTKNIQFINIACKGSGRKSGNATNGVAIINCNNVTVDSFTISGYQKAGLMVYCSDYINILRVKAIDNGFAGIFITGRTSKKDCRNIYVAHCRAENNPGDPTNLTNHSGNGILAAQCTNVTIEHSVATNNGWDMPRKGNGPVGIWTYESDSVLIQYCTSFKNRTSAGSLDGGGFDFDGGVTNSILQYCLSYENEGSGIGLFQYEGASPWRNNIIRYNTSRDDGTGHVKAGVLVWNSAEDASQLADCFFYGNTIQNKEGACIRYDSSSAHTRFHFYDNKFDCKQEAVHDDRPISSLLQNEHNSAFVP